MIHICTAIAPTNIAVVKYWGKRDKSLNLPINSSISVTLDSSDLRTVTTAAACIDFDKDRLWLNGKEVSPENNPRLKAVFDKIRCRSSAPWKNFCVHVASENSFPTGAGLASSASGFACLVKALAELFKLQGDVSDIARLGSGSACRSLFGGYVKWSMGQREDGSDSIAEQVSSEKHWDSLHALICVIDDSTKTTSSTEGMIRSVETSLMLKFRAESVVPRRIDEMEKAIKSCDFQRFGKITMEESNSFHASCLDTFPPIKYMTDASFEVVSFVHKLNSEYGCIVAAYTFDAGPNAVIFCEEENVASVLESLLKSDACGPVEVRGKTTKKAKNGSPKSAVQYIIHSKVGLGAVCLSDDSGLYLLDKETGLPSGYEELTAA